MNEYNEKTIIIIKLDEWGGGGDRILNEREK